MKKICFLCFLASFLFAGPSMVAALPYATPADSFGSYATFAVSGDVHTITVVDLRLATGNVGGQELTAFFFDIPGSVTLAPQDAVIANGSSVFMLGSFTAPTNGNVGGEWAYGTGYSNPGYGSRFLTASGLGLPASIFFDPANLWAIPALDGGQGALVYPAAGATASGNNKPLINNSVVFTFVGATGFVPSSANVTNTVFWYSTNDIPNHQVPEPTTMLLLGLGLVGLAEMRKKYRK